MPRKSAEPSENSILHEEGGPVKMSIIVTRKLLEDVRAVQKSQGIDNFSHFIRLFLRKHLPSYLSEEALNLEGEFREMVNLPTTDDLRTAQQLGTSPVDLIRQILSEHVAEWVEKARKRQEALDQLRKKLGD